jgi:16S rRNA processing protein RimM
MTFDNLDLFEIGYVQKTHGLKGHLNIKILDEISNDILNEDIPVFLEIEGIPVPFFIEELKKSANYIILKLKDVNSADFAERFKSCSAYIIADSIKSENDFLIESDFELYNYDVFDKNYGYVGKMKTVNFIPGNPVFETELNGKTVILPYSEEFIENISHEEKRIDIISPEGLINLYL